jgi:phosphatidylethanolamine/phosphatidyl-N-methylethanolamine N-methyltransferase
MAVADYIDFSDFYLQACVVCIILAPTIWNILARIEYFTHIITKIACGNKYLGCYLLTAWIFSFSIFRDYMYVPVSSHAEAPFCRRA